MGPSLRRDGSEKYSRIQSGTGSKGENCERKAKKRKKYIGELKRRLKSSTLQPLQKKCIIKGMEGFKEDILRWKLKCDRVDEKKKNI